MIPYGRQSLDDEDVKAVVETLRSDFLTQGPKINEFEQAVASYCGASHAVAVNSATSALHLACLALGVQAGDSVWTSPISFVASANCARYCGANVDFVDIDALSGNLSISALESKLRSAQKAGSLPKVLVAVHFAGQPCDMKEISRLSVRYGFQVIEDAAHAIGSRYKESVTGSCQYSDITIFSFHPVKVITSAEGGMAMTNDDKLAERMRRLASHGITRNSDEMSGDLKGDWVYQQIELGFNYRISDIHAALGISQLSKLERFVERRNALAQIYDQAFEGSGLEPMRVSDDRLSSYHLYSVLLPKYIDREKTFDSLRQVGIGVNVHYIPIYKQPYYQELGFESNYCPNAELFYECLITLPLYPTMTTKEMDFVIDKVLQALSYDSAAVRNSPGDC